ncbi:uncharacterized protein LOC144119870 [Amblyomma americanum]
MAPSKRQLKSPTLLEADGLRLPRGPQPWRASSSTTASSADVMQEGFSPLHCLVLGVFMGLVASSIIYLAFTTDTKRDGSSSIDPQGITDFTLPTGRTRTKESGETTDKSNSYPTVPITTATKEVPSKLTSEPMPDPTKETTTAEDRYPVPSHEPDREVFTWLDTCHHEYANCSVMGDSLIAFLRDQLDPCRDFNKFVCQVTPRPRHRTRPAAFQQGEAASNMTGSPELGTPSGAASLWSQQSPAGGHLLSAKRYSGTDKLKQACYRYAASLEEGQTYLADLLHGFKLHPVDTVYDAEEDPVDRLLHIAFIFRLQPLVTFERRLVLTRHPSEFYDVWIDVAEELREFVTLWPLVEKDAWKPFYDACLTNSGANLSGLELTSLREKLYSADGKHKLKEKLAEKGELPLKLYDKVNAKGRALALIGFLGRPSQRIAMLRLLGWRVLVYLLR